MFYFWKEYWAVGYDSIQVWDFSKIPQFPKILRFTLFGNSWDNLYTMFCDRYQVPLFLWQIKHILKS